MRVLQLFSLIFISTLLFDISACRESQKEFRDQDKLFHAAPEGNGISSLSFALYNDNRYQVMSSGGIGAEYYSGTYTVNADIIVLNNLSKESGLQSNRLKIFRYNQQDSSYWFWKYEKSIGIFNWDVFERQDRQLGDGDVYQLDDKNKPMKDKYHFIIRLDSLQNHFR